MKNFICSILAILCALAFTGCSDMFPPDNPLSPNGSELITIYANTPAPEDMTKVEYSSDGNSGLLVEWSEDETISILRGGENATFTKTNGNEFSGTLPDEGGEGYYYALYPANPAATDETQVPFDLSLQKGVLDSKLNYMTASSEEIIDRGDVNFAHWTALLKPTFTGMENDEAARTITIQSEVYTKGKLDLTNRTTSGDDVKYITVQMDNEGTPYIYIPPMGSGKTLAITVISNKGNMYSASITSSKAIISGVQYSVSIALTKETTDDYRWYNGITATETSNIRGTGTEEDPYIIHTAHDLQWLIDQSSYGNYERYEANDYDIYKTILTLGKYYKLTHDLYIDSDEDVVDGEGNVVQARGWTPIGPGYEDEGWDIYDSFIGHFDGGGHTISGKMVPIAKSISKEGGQMFGFFGWCSEYKDSPEIEEVASIRNLHMDVTVECDSKVTEQLYYGGIPSVMVGAIVGHVDGDLFDISNCTVRGKVQGGISSGTTAAHTSVGGLIGLGNPINSMSDCHNYSTVIGGYPTSPCYQSYTGGLIGYAYDSDLTISDCTNNGPVNAGTASQNAQTGGLAGTLLSYKNMTDCHNYADITGGNVTDDGNNSEPWQYIGGLCGNDGDGTMYNCSNSGKITSGAMAVITGSYASPNSTVRIGGLSGYCGSLVSQCTNTGDIVVSTVDNAEVGGIAGQYHTGTMTSTSNYGEFSFNGDIIQSCTLGGLVGVAENTENTINDCTNNAPVVGNNGTWLSRTGGLIGTAGKININGCTNNGDVTGGTGGLDTSPSYATGYTGFSSYTGGIVGHTSSANLTGCINSGDISGTTSQRNIFTGGIVGYVQGGGVAPYIAGCINEGSVTGGVTKDATSYKSYTGGISGYMGYTSIIRSKTTNKGAVSVGNYLGSIVGFCSDNSDYPAKVCTCTQDLGGNIISLIGGGTTTLVSIGDCTH